MFEYHPNTDITLTFMSYNTCYFHYRQIISPFLKSPTWLPTKLPTFIVGNPLPQKTVTYWVSSIFLSDILPTCLRHLHRHYRHYYRHITAKTIFAPTFYTDIYTDKTASTFSVHRPTAN